MRNQVFTQGSNSKGALADERGMAFLEFLIALPFIALLVFSIVDLGRVLNQYLLLTQAVHEGVKLASTVPGLEAGKRNSGSLCEPDAASVDTIHGNVHKRVSELITLQSFAFLGDELCVSSDRTNPTTVSVQVEAKYASIFPVFNGMNIRVRAEGPFLF